MQLGPGGEFDLLRQMVGEPRLPPEVRVGPGDDGAVLEGGWVISTDLSMEGIHFRRDWLDLREIGYRATAAALSDLAAMAARPVAVFLSLAVPANGAAEAATALQEGARDAARALGAEVVGGDLSRSPGPVVVDAVVVGRTDRPLLRSGGRPGDLLWVTGRLGGSAGAVRLLAAGRPVPEGLREAFARPRPRTEVAIWLMERGPLRAGLDLSDGLAGDAGHLAAAGGVRIRIRADDLPLHPDLLSGDLSPREARSLALRGGEDYELAFLAPPGVVEPLVAGFEARFGLSLTRVGEAEEGSGVVVVGEERGDAPSPGGFSHFEDGRSDGP